MAKDSVWNLEDQYEQEGQYIRATSAGYGYETKPRIIFEDGVQKVWTGAGLIKSDQTLVRSSSGAIKTEYDLNIEPAMFLVSLNPSDRAAQMRILADAGFIDRGSIGDYASELRAITNAMEMANFAGLEWGNAVRQRISGQPVGRTGGAARTYRTSSPDDLKKVGNKVAQQTLGREFTQAEADQFVRAYQQQEIQFQRSAYGGGTVQEAPSMDVAAETFAQQAAPQEAAGYKYLGYINQLFDSIGVG